MANLYSKRSVKVQKKSGFDKSFQNLFTSKVGTLTPILCDEVIPNTSVHLKAAISAALPPLASDTFMRCKLKYASFFVPSRILLPHGAYEKWLTGDDSYRGSDVNKIVLPLLELTNAKCNNSVNASSPYASTRSCQPGSLADFLGVKCTIGTAPVDSSLSNNAVITVNALPFLAYHKIWNDWFRNSLVQKDIYDNAGTTTFCVSTLNNMVPNSISASQYLLKDSVSNIIERSQSCLFNDGVSLTELRQANFDIDMFTSASPEPQNGEAQQVRFDLVDADSGDPLTESGFTISALRAANSIQQWLERNNIAGNRLVDYVHAQYGANLNDAIAQRPVLLGSGQFDVYSKGIYQTGMDNSVGYTQNPFSSVGSRYGSAYADGSDILINGFTANEPGYIMVLAWLSPRVTYSTGVDPMLLRYQGLSKQSDMANPILQNVGNEPISAKQITDKSFLFDSQVFGYQDRYFSWKDRIDEVHGILRDGSDLESFALQRTFSLDNAPQISSNFLQIPVDYLDQVSAVNGDVSKYGYWCDTYFDYKVSMPLARYSVPSLQDPAYEHGEDVIVNTRGTQLT